MTRVLWVLICAGAILSLVSCELPPAEEGTEPAVPEAPTVAEPAAPAEPAAVAEDKPWEKDMTKDCPGNATTSEVALAKNKKGYVLTITDEVDHEVSSIRQNARYVAGATEHAEDPIDALKFPGVTGDRASACVVILEGTKVAYEEVEGGARLTVTAKKVKKAKALIKDAQKRLADLNEKKAIFREMNK